MLLEGASVVDFSFRIVQVIPIIRFFRINRRFNRGKARVGNRRRGETGISVGIEGGSKTSVGDLRYHPPVTFDIWILT